MVERLRCDLPAPLERVLPRRRRFHRERHGVDSVRVARVAQGLELRRVDVEGGDVRDGRHALTQLRQRARKRCSEEAHCTCTDDEHPQRVRGRREGGWGSSGGGACAGCDERRLLSEN
jgi:hypothetical protein